MAEKENFKWYPIRVTYGRELKFQSYMERLGIDTFIPMRYRHIVSGGKKKRILAPAVSNLCFVYSSRETIDDVRGRLAATLPVHYIWDKSTSMPIVVPDKAMEDFMKVSSAFDEDIVYISGIVPVLSAGQKVRVKAGLFSGVEGKVVRIRKSKRVMVELPGMFAVATAYIRSEWLEPVNKPINNEQ